jgi:hypothetical protein
MPGGRFGRLSLAVASARVDACRVCRTRKYALISVLAVMLLALLAAPAESPLALQATAVAASAPNVVGPARRPAYPSLTRVHAATRFLRSRAGASRSR